MRKFILFLAFFCGNLVANAQIFDSLKLSYFEQINTSDVESSKDHVLHDYTWTKDTSFFAIDSTTVLINIKFKLINPFHKKITTDIIWTDVPYLETWDNSYSQLTPKSIDYKSFSTIQKASFQGIEKTVLSKLLTTISSSLRKELSCSDRKLIKKQNGGVDLYFCVDYLGKIQWIYMQFDSRYLNTPIKDLSAEFVGELFKKLKSRHIFPPTHNPGCLYMYYVGFSFSGFLNGTLYELSFSDNSIMIEYRESYLNFIEMDTRLDSHP